MAYCKKCGTTLVDGAKFCQKCGTKVDATTPDSSTRQQEYVGKIYKCPRCGEVLESFVSNCPACGLELRGTKATSSVREFALKLEAIEASRRFEIIPQFSNQAEADKFISSTDHQKISLIENFAVPNTKEDILEFMILATSNIDPSAYGTTEPTRGQKAMANAWYSKIKQTYIKAKSTYGEDPDFPKVRSLYDDCCADIKQQKKKKIIKWAFIIGSLPLLFVVLFASCEITSSISSKREDMRETEHLNNIVEEIQNQIAEGKYKYALMNTNYLVWDSVSDTEERRYWKLQREYWVDTILEQAASEGIVLERPDDPPEPTPIPTPTPTTDIDDLLRTFVSVFTEEEKVDENSN